MTAPSTYRFSTHHAWADKRGDLVYVGVSHYAQSKLSDIVFADVPAEGDWVRRDEPFCQLESIKTVSDVIAPVSGVVVLVNQALDANPGAINADPYGAWIAAIQPSDPADWDALVTETEYVKNA